MNDREQRGLTIAALTKLVRKGGIWVVPSQSGPAKYTVCPDPINPHCTCADHETRGCKCKHIFAVEFAMKREEAADGTVTETRSITLTEKRTTYTQDWPAYNAAQTTEKGTFQVMLRDLCNGIQEPQQGMGRPRILLRDALFAACFKVYSTFSGRRFMTDLKEAHGEGHLTRCPSYNSIFAVFESPETDGVQLPKLLGTTAQRFTVKEVSADLAYSTNTNLAEVDALGASPMIPFKRNAVATSGGLWSKMFHYFQFHRQEFLSRYHLRSNVESTFSMIKRKFGDSLRSKTDVAMKNETLAKLVCHNICCVIQEMHESGVDPTFWADSAVAQKGANN